MPGCSYQMPCNAVFSGKFQLDICQIVSVKRYWLVLVQHFLAGIACQGASLIEKCVFYYW